MNKTVLITGVSSGIGREAAVLLARKGFRVFGTVRKETGGLDGVELVKLDVTETPRLPGPCRRLPPRPAPSAAS